MSTIMMVPTNRLHPHPQNVRSDLGDLRTLVNSVESQGVLEPLLIREQEQPDGFQVVAGHRRLAAAQKVGLEEVPCILRDLSDEDTVALMLVENLQREDIDAYDEARGYFRLVEFGWTQKKLAEEVGVSAATIRNRLRLLQLPPEWAVDWPHGADDLAEMVELTEDELWDDEQLVEAFEGAPRPQQVATFLQSKRFHHEKQQIVESLPEDEPLIEKESSGAYGGRRRLPRNHVFIQCDDLSYDEDGINVDLETVRENGHLGWYVDTRGYGDKRRVVKLAVITDRGYYTRKSSPADEAERPEGWEEEQARKAEERAERQRRKEAEALRRDRIADATKAATKTALIDIIVDRGINDLHWKAEQDAAIAMGLAVIYEDGDHEGKVNVMETAKVIRDLSQTKRVEFLAHAQLISRSDNELGNGLLDEYAPID